MPKITTANALIDGEYNSINISYNQKKSFYTDSIPSKVTAILGSDYRLSGYPSLVELKNAIREGLKLYHEKIKKTRKVIAYTLELSTSIAMNKESEGYYSGRKKWIPKDIKIESIDTDGYGFAIDYKVYMEISGAKKEYRRITDEGEVEKWEAHINRDEIIVDWTQQREDTLKRIQLELEELAKKIGIYFWDNDKMLNLLDHPTNKLLNP